MIFDRKLYKNLLLLILPIGFRWAAAPKSQAPGNPKFRSFFGNLAEGNFRLPLSLFHLSFCHLQIYHQNWRQFWESGISIFPKKWPLFGQSESSSFFLSMWSTTRQICDRPSIPPVSMLVPWTIAWILLFCWNLNISINTIELIGADSGSNQLPLKHNTFRRYQATSCEGISITPRFHHSLGGGKKNGMLGPAVPTSNVSGLELRCRCRSTKPIEKNILMTRSCSGSWTVGCKSGHPARPPETSDFEPSLTETLPCFTDFYVYEKEKSWEGLDRKERNWEGLDRKERSWEGLARKEKSWVGLDAKEMKSWEGWIGKRRVE